MTRFIDETLAELTSRMPELEWKISNLPISRSNLPKGLFSLGTEITGLTCIEEIKADIKALSFQNNERSALYLATRIKQKINILVSLYQIHARKQKPIIEESFGIKMLSTRQQWLRSLENDINTLILQQKALTNTLELMTSGASEHALLTVKGDLGEIERRLTLAREAYNQAIS
ncbi:MAG TPA: hypothetical protein PK657_02220 [Legionella sp.]|nr:hypothetical protein [Legionella sp.]